jgi:CubicO group peptidase (beta-lactamase class C family)
MAMIEAARDFIPRAMAFRNVPGLALAVALNGRLVWEEGFGFSDLAAGRPMTARTVMRSGSMGKVHTGIAVMQLVERGHVHLDQPVNGLVDFAVVNPRGPREITVRDLLTHRSGMSGAGVFSTYGTPLPLGTVLEQAFRSETSEMWDGEAVPTWSGSVGERYEYSNLAVATLGYIVERVNPEGLSFSEYQQRHVIDLLGMTATQYPPYVGAEHVRPEILAECSSGYAQFGPVRIPTPDIRFASFPCGGVVTTPADHLRILQAFLAGGRLGDRQLLEADTVREMLTPQDVAGLDGAAFSQGLIWRLYDRGGIDPYFGHGGAHMYGWHNDFRAYPGLGLALVVATNQWEMMRNRADIPGIPVHELIARFLVAWLREDQVPGAGHTWAWKCAYFAGLELVQQLHMLGLSEPLPESVIDGMVAGTRVQPGAGDDLWDPDGFRTGLAEMFAVGPGRADVDAFFGSNRLQLLPGELDLLRLRLGAVG